MIVLDEFPYLCEANKGLPSLIQQFWDQRGKRSSLMLVLCGSQVSFMEREVLAERSPLFGRRTGQRRLEPLAPSEALFFFPAWSVDDGVLAYGILGGMPAYLQRFAQELSVRENLMREVLRPEGYLFDEVNYLLRTELQNPATYNSILGAVARGAERVGDIALSVGVDSPTANKYLHVLRELGIVERVIPLTDPDPLRSRRGVYRIADRFVAFHFRHVQPHLSLIEAGRGSRVYEEFIQPDLERLQDAARTDLIVEHLRRDAAELVGEEMAEVGHHGGRVVRALGPYRRGPRCRRAPGAGLRSRGRPGPGGGPGDPDRGVRRRDRAAGLPDAGGFRETPGGPQGSRGGGPLDDSGPGIPAATSTRSTAPGTRTAASSAAALRRRSRPSSASTRTALRSTPTSTASRTW